MLTRGIFENTASILNESVRSCLVKVDDINIPGLVNPGMHGEYRQISLLAAHFADWFAEDNPRFDRERFMQAVYRCN